MEIVRLGSALRIRGSSGAVGKSRQLALALACAVVPRLRQWTLDKASTEADIEALQQSLDEWQDPALRSDSESAQLTEEREGLEQGLLRLNAELRHLDARPWPWGRPAWMLIWGGKWRTERDGVSQRIAGTKARLDEIRQRFQSQLDGLSQRLEEAKARRDALEDMPRVVEGLRMLDYVLVPTSIPGTVEAEGGGRAGPGWILSDTLVQPSELEAARPASTGPELEDLRTAVRALVDGPHTHRVDERNRDREEGLPIGVERDLVTAAERLARLGADGESRRLLVPLLDPEEPLVEHVARRLRELSDEVAQPVAAEVDRQSAQRMRGLVRGVVALREQLASARAVPTPLMRDLASGAERLAPLAERLSSMGVRTAEELGTAVEAAGVNALLARYRLICPECNALPEYLAAVHGLSEELVQSFDTKGLEEVLLAYRDRRLDTRHGRAIPPGSPESHLLEDRWQQAFDELARLEQSLRYHQAERTALDGHASRTTTDRLTQSLLDRRIREATRRYRSLVDDLVRQPLALPGEPADATEDPGAESDRTHLVADLRDTVRTGSDLKYDPDEDTTPWCCMSCRTSYSLDRALFGAIDRIRTEVVDPMVSSLWSEDGVRQGTDAAVAKAREQVRERAEEEAAALSQPVEMFRHEARVLRQQVEQAHERGRALAKRLVLIAEQFERFELLPGEELERVRQAAGGTTRRMSETQEALERLRAAEEALERTVERAKAGRSLPELPHLAFVRANFAQATPLIPHLPAAEAAQGLETESIEAPAASGDLAVPDTLAAAAANGPACPACGAKAPLDSAFCVACGATLAAPEGSPQALRPTAWRGGPRNAPTGPDRQRRTIPARWGRPGSGIGSPPPTTPPRTDDVDPPQPTEGSPEP